MNLVHEVSRNTKFIQKNEKISKENIPVLDEL